MKKMIFLLFFLAVSVLISVSCSEEGTLSDIGIVNDIINDIANDTANDIANDIANDTEIKDTSICTPDCTNKFCGDGDGCGSKCTACQNSREICNIDKWMCERQKYKFIDIHSHIFKSDQDLNEISTFTTDNNIEYIYLSGFYSDSSDINSDLDDKIISASEKIDNIIPFLRGFLLTEQKSVQYVSQRLGTNKFKGIGELIVNGHGTRLGADSPIMMDIYSLAGQYKVPVLIHFTFGSTNVNEPGGDEQVNQLKKALSQNPNTTIIVAHCGAGPAPHTSNYKDNLEMLLTNYPNLYFDIAGMHIDLYQNNTLTPLAEIIIDVIKKYPDRFLVGFDFDDIMYPYENGTEIIQYYENFLDNFEITVSQKVAYDNAKKVLKLQ